MADTPQYSEETRKTFKQYESTGTAWAAPGSPLTSSPLPSSGREGLRHLAEVGLRVPASRRR